MKTDQLPVLIQQFFADYLKVQRNLSSHTIAAYRDTFHLLLVFLASYHRQRVDQLTLEAFCPKAILAFLEDLERKRHNTPRTRNVRLAAIRTFIRFVIGQSPAADFLSNGQRILAIPLKRSPSRVLGILTRPEINAVLSAIDPTTWFGSRDRLLFLLLYNTGARVAEALSLHGKDLHDRSVLLHGKGRKERIVPLWPQTARLFRNWCRSNNIGPEQPVFINRSGDSLTRDGVAFRLSSAVVQATAQCPSLAGRNVTPHTLRHTCAMHLLQSGVALEIIGLWLGHERPITTHLYIEADLKLKRQCLALLQRPSASPKRKRNPYSGLLAFLEAI